MAARKSVGKCRGSRDFRNVSERARNGNWNWNANRKRQQKQLLFFRLRSIKCVARLPDGACPPPQPTHTHSLLLGSAASPECQSRLAICNRSESYGHDRSFEVCIAENHRRELPGKREQELVLTGAEMQQCWRTQAERRLGRDSSTSRVEIKAKDKRSPDW